MEYIETLWWIREFSLIKYLIFILEIWLTAISSRFWRGKVRNIIESNTITYITLRINTAIKCKVREYKTIGTVEDTYTYHISSKKLYYKSSR